MGFLKRAANCLNSLTQDINNDYDEQDSVEDDVVSTPESIVIGTTKSGKSIYQPYSMGYGKIKFGNNTVLKDNFKDFSSTDHKDAALINKEAGLILMNDFRLAVQELLSMDFTKPVFNPNKTPQYTTKDCFTEEDFHNLSSKEVDEVIDFIQDNGYEGKIQGLFYMYYYHNTK